MRLSIVTLGHVHNEDIEKLTTHFEHLEQLVLDIAPREPLAKHRAELNRAIDAASTDWILIIRERETIDEALAAEIARVMADGKARGFRLRAVPYYAGQPLQLTRDDGEVRLFHRRSYMRYADKGEWEELTIQGTVVRLASALRSVTFATPEEHEQQLARTGTRHSYPRRVLVFLGYALGARVRDRNTLRYLWIEAAYTLPGS
ncbi:MAG: hypothetical protein QOH21_1118 [Acidobacteriota bacterium]|nr:hypothetical protein [Acidobacteriota bacterium]